MENFLEQQNSRREKKEVLIWVISEKKRKAFLLPHLMFVTHASQFLSLLAPLFSPSSEQKDKFFKFAHAKMTECSKKAAK